MRSPAKRLPALFLLLAACGGPVLYGEVEIPELGITLSGQSFPAMIGLGNSRCGSTPACVATDFTYDIGSDVEVINQAHVSYTLKLTGLAIAEDPGASVDLSGIASAEVVVVPGDGSAPVVLATYTRPAGGGRVTTLTADTVSDVNLERYVQSGTVHLRAELAYDGPTPGFTASIAGVFYLDATIDYGKEIGL